MVRKKLNTNTNGTENFKFRKEPDNLQRLARSVGLESNAYPITYRKQIMGELLDYCENEMRRLSIEQFCFAKGLRRATLNDWSDSDPWCKQMLETAVAILASRRYELALFKEVDKDIFKLDQHKYDKSWHDVNEYHAALKRKEEPQPTKFILEMSQMPETDKVPKKDAE